MSLITKHRPKAFSEVIGQDAAVKSMQRAIVDRSAQTYLITGPSGVGKTTLARIAAKTVGAHKADTFLHNGVVHTGIEDMRGLLEVIAYRPNHGEASAIIVDEFHGLSKQAMNAILDCTEEPPEWLYWFICTTEPTKVPKPVVTRSLHIPLKPVRDTVMKPWLKNIAKADKLSTKFIDLCVEGSGGSPRQALVNLAAVQGAKDEEQAGELLSSAEETTDMIDLAKLLTKGGRLSDACSIIKRMKDTNQNPEAVRVMIVRYLTAVALNTKAPKHLAVLEEFSTPFPPQDGLAPVLVGCARLMK